jgi:hypothetical protein
MKKRDHLEDIDVDGNNIELCLKETRFECVDWNHLAQDGDRLWAFVNTVMNLLGDIKGRASC